jgi:hypothetical protein
MIHIERIIFHVREREGGNTREHGNWVTLSWKCWYIVPITAEAIAYLIWFFTFIGITGLFYCTWNKFACKALHMVKGHHVSTPPSYWITNEFSFFMFVSLKCIKFKMSTWRLLHEIIFLTLTFWNLTVELHIFSFTCHH